MKLLYGVVGEGMGHATRSRVVIDHLLTAGHEVHVVVSGRAWAFLHRHFALTGRCAVTEIRGFHMHYEGNALALGRSIVENLGKAPASLVRNLATWLGMDFEADAVISDFESWAFFYGLNHMKPVISIDNMQVIHRCEHPDVITGDPDFQLARAAVKVKLPGAHHYLVTTFFRPPLRKDRTTLVPPILRPEVLAAKREPGKHVLVYQTGTSNEALVSELQRLPFEFRLYGMRREEQRGNVRLRDFSETGFVEDLRTARAVVAGGGFSLMSEAVHLGVPMYAVPLEGQYEQELNARYLAMLGYGMFATRFEADRIGEFVERAPEHTDYVPRDNRELFDHLDGLLADLRG
jgi:uncharacterized protein (TIGR00661 family)